MSARVALSTPIHLARHITFVWTIPDMTMYDTFREQICWCYKRSGTPGYPTLHLQIYVTRQKDATADAFALQPGDVITKRPEGWGGERGGDVSHHRSDEPPPDRQVHG